jgi:DNA-binding NtrC family response regulator
MNECSTSHFSELILIVDPDQAFGPVLQEILGPRYNLRLVPSIEAALRQLECSEIDVVLLNLDSRKSPAISDDPFFLLRAISERSPSLPVIAYGSGRSREIVLQAFREGIFDFLEQPLDVQELKFALNRACRQAALARDLAAAQNSLGCVRVEGLLGNSRVMEHVNDVIRKVSAVGTTVLVTGESGTGKGVVARAIHRMSPRANKPFVEFALCAFPDSLIEDELFGHEKGAFTGAIQMRKGRFEEANGGTIFLDEIGELPLHLQVKLLHVLQERTVQRLGSNIHHPVDVRVICATNRNLEKMMNEGGFRSDLFFRLSVVSVNMPPLRDRSEDVPLLAEYFLKMFAKIHSKKIQGLSPAYLSALATHGWPGNVRELQNVIERSLVLSNGEKYLAVRDLPPALQGLIITEEVPGGPFQQSVQSYKRELVRSALRMHNGNKLRAARELGISRCYLHRLLNQLKITEFSEDAVDAQQLAMAEAIDSDLLNSAANA